MRSVSVLDRHSLAAEPWRNGGGVTRTIVAKANAWRVSVAEISRDGPFSRFEGMVRTSLLLHGTGIQLQAGGQSVAFSTEVPARYDGAPAWDASLADGPVTVLNVMCASGVCHAKVELLRDESIDLAPRLAVIVFGAAPGCLVAGADIEQPIRLSSGEVCVMEPSEFGLRIYRNDWASFGKRVSPLVIVTIASDDDKVTA